MKTELKTLLHNLHPIALNKDTILVKMLTFCKKNAGTSKIKRVLVLQDIFSESTYVYVLTYQISSF